MSPAPHHVFLHVPKTAGSTLRTVLSRQYGARHVLYFDLGFGDPRPMAELVPELRQQAAQRAAKLFTGHQYLGLHAALGEPCLYFTLLRDPVERALSEYFYAFSYPHHAKRAEILSGELGPMEFLTQRHGGGNAQAQQIAGRTQRPLLEAALANLRHAVAAVGVAEDFERSLLLIARRMGWAPPLHVARNVTKLDPAQAEARAQAREAAAAHRGLFATDQALYDAAQDRLAADCAAEGPDFELALAAFRRCQAALAENAGESVFERYEFGSDDTLPPWVEAVLAGPDHALVAEFLARPPVPTPPPVNLIGQVEEVADGLVRGWASNLMSLRPVTLRLMAGDTPLAAIRAQRFHPGEGAARFAQGCCGFRLPLPENPPGPLRLVAEGTNIALPDPGSLLAG